MIDWNLPGRCLLLFILVLMWGWLDAAHANIPGGGTGAGANVTLTDNGSTVTIANGIISIVVTKADASIHTINYTYNNGSGTVTNPLLAGGDGGGGGMLYWTGNPASFGTMNYTYSLVANTGTYAEISLVSTSTTNGVMEVDYSMFKGSPGFYCTPILTHRSVDGPVYIELRPNIYAGLQFNWMTVDSARNKLMEVSGGIMLAVPNAPKECYLWTNGIYQGRYDDKYKYAADMGLTKVWGWSSVGTSGSNVGLWCVTASGEYYPGGPLERSLMEHIGTTVLNVFTGGYYGMSQDGTIGNGDVWTKVYGPYFYYFNNAPKSITDPVLVSGSLYADAKAQQAAEQSAWPYTWYNNANYAQAANRGTVTGQIVISDTGNPNASAAGLWVGVVQQPAADDTVYDFQEWCRPYQFWTQTDANGNFTIPTVISGTNYTLYAFGPGSNDTFMSKAQTGGTPPLLVDLPSTPFSVTVTGGATTSLGTVTWKPARVGPTVFEIGYPNRTANKFRHGEDYWVGDIGPSPTTPSPVWTKYLEYQFDFPNGPNYIVGSSRWSTDWNFIQPAVLSSGNVWNNSSSNITFTLPSGTSLNGNASIYLGLAVDYYSAIIVTVNGQNLGSVAGISASPNTSVPTTGYYAGYADGDASIREGNNGSFSDERITFPANILKTGTNLNVINIGIRQVGGGYFANHAMYDYVRLELTGYLPAPPGSVTAFAGNHSALVTWPVVPGATSYNILRSTTSGSGYTSLATGVVGPVCGSGSSSATYADSTAVNSTPYYYVVRSVNVTGTSANSPQSASVTPLATAPTTAPAVPTGLTVTATNAAVMLNWTASTGANYYTVLRSTLYNNGGSIYNAANTYNVLNTIVLSNTVTGTTYTDVSPTNGSTYSYTVMASNAVGTSSTATAANAVPLPPGPAAPTGLIGAPGIDQAGVSWQAVPGAQGYIVQYSTTPGGPYTYLASITSLEYTETGLAANTTYYFIVNAVNAGGVSANSTQLSVTTPPPAPGTLNATPGNTQVGLSWTSAAGATSYVIERGSVTGGPYTNVGTANGLSFTDSGLTNGDTYYYVVAGVNSGGAGATSPEANATPTSGVPVAPLSLKASGGPDEINLSWNASAGATGYNVYRASVTGGPYTLVSSSVSGTNYSDSGLPVSATYYYVVTATDAGGESAYSNEASATTQAYIVVYSKWDHLGASPANPADGSGSWNTTSALWSNGTTDAAWVNSGTNGATIGNHNGAAGTVTVGNITAGGLAFNPATSGSYTLSSGTLTLTGTGVSIAANANVAISSVLSGTGAFLISGSGAVTFSGSNTYTGLTSDNGAALNVTGGILATPEIALSATTSMTLSGAVTLSSVLTLDSGVATIASGTTTDTNNTNTNLHLGADSSAATLNVNFGAAFADTSGTNAFLNIGYGASSIGLLDNAGTASISVAGGLGGNLGNNTNASGAIYNTGVLTQNSNSAGPNGSGFYIGNNAGAYGYIYSSGTFTNAGYMGLSRNDTASTAGACGVVDVAGGAFTVTNAANLTLNDDASDSTASMSQVDVTAGTFTAGSTAAGMVTVNGVANAYASINVSGNSAVMMTPGASGINLNATSNANNVATLTLAHNGTLDTSNIENTGSALSTGVLSLNGGTLGATASGVLIATGVTTYVESSGVTINNNGFDTAINSPLQAPTGSGMTALVLEGTDTGYIGAPVVVVSGGGGVGAAAIATFNPATGTFTGFRITSPGSGYTSVPTVTLYGGDGIIGDGAAAGTATASVNMGAVTSGGITFSGAGTTTLDAANTYSGATTVSAGVLNLGNSLALQDSTVTSINGGLTFDLSVTSDAFTLGGLSGSGAIALQNNANTPAAITLSIGNNGSSQTYSGALTGAGGLTKIGAGTQILSGACGYTGATSVVDGILEITGTLSGTSSLTVANGSVFYLAGGGLSVSGGITNNGTFKLSGTPSLALTGTFTNNGVLDLINGPSTLPPNFVNHGTVLDSSTVQVLQATLSGSSFSLTIQGYAQHTYQLQSTSSISPSNWQNVGVEQTGNNATLTFTDSGGATGSNGFYRVIVTP